MINVIIVEDEDTAADRLTDMLEELPYAIKVVNRLDSISATVDYLSSNNSPDLIFMDIHLADGASFDVFKQIDVSTPVIFTTAYDEYALQAFKVNSVDYLLKPIKRIELEAAVAKYQNLNAPDVMPLLEKLKLLTAETNTYQKRMVVKFGQMIKAIEVEDIAYFYTEDRIVLLCTKDGQRIPVDYKLDELEGIIDPSKFFRVNRQIITGIKAIDKMYAYSKSRIKLTLNPPLKEEAIVSTERASEFKDWLKGKTV